MTIRELDAQRACLLYGLSPDVGFEGGSGAGTHSCQRGMSFPLFVEPVVSLAGVHTELLLRSVLGSYSRPKVLDAVRIAALESGSSMVSRRVVVCV